MPKIKLLSYMFAIYDKNVERKKKKETNTEKNKQDKQALNPTISLIIVILHIKFEFSILYGCERVGNKILRN